VIYAAHPRRGAFVVGVTIARRGAILIREARCGRWSLIRVRAAESIERGDWPDGAPGIGVREPRRPRPGGLSGTATADPAT
jgi:hypothetical protein